MCVLTSSRLDDFSDIDGYLYTVVIAFWHFSWRGGGGRGSFSFSNTLDRTLIGVALTEPPVSRVMTEIALDFLTHKAMEQFDTSLDPIL